MPDEHSYELSLDSECFRFLCGHLNQTARKPDARWAVSILSGGFKFNDEVPDDVGDGPEIVLPLVTLIRCLWAYRCSLIEGHARPELAPYWNATKRLAPNWVGFAEDRCGQAMQPIVAEGKAQELQFVLDEEHWEAERKKKDRENKGKKPKGSGVDSVARRDLKQA